MNRKRKVSLTIDEGILAEIDKAAEARNAAKSRVAEEAFRLWLKTETEALMAKGYEDMAEKDGAFAERTLHAQGEALS